MTCWIEDEFHLEAHSLQAPVRQGQVPALARWEVEMFERMTEGMRSCSVYCSDGTHATVAFITDHVAEDAASGHVIGQFMQHHPTNRPIKAERAHEVTPEMYPKRKHRGSPAEPSEKLTAWLVYFKKETYGQS